MNVTLSKFTPMSHPKYDVEMEAKRVLSEFYGLAIYFIFPCSLPFIFFV